MGKYIKLVIGVFLVFSSIVGGVNILSGGLQATGMRIVENGTDTVGYVEKRVKHTVGAKIGRVPGIGAYYMIHYRFKTLDGKSYSDSVKATKEQAYAMRDGQKLNIRYMKGQPSINSVMDIETYMDEETARDVPWGAVIPALLAFFFGGLWLVWSSWRAIGWSLPSAGRKDTYQIDRGAMLNGGGKPGVVGNQPMFGGRK